MIAEAAPPAAASGDWTRWFATVTDGTETGALMRTIDWAATSLGHPSLWSNALRAAVGTCMTSRFPMLVVWGPDLVKIYNDGYRSIMGPEKHPGAMGAPVRAVWPEIWHLIGPRFDTVLTTGVATWDENQLMYIERNGRTEECYFSYSYSPLFDDDGSIAGVLDTVVENTSTVITARRLTALAQLRQELVAAADVTDACVRASRSLSRSADLRAVDVYVRVDGVPALVSSGRRDGSAPPDPEDVWRALGDVAWTVVPDGRGGERVLISLGEGTSPVDGVVAATPNANRPFDDGYQTFVELVAASIESALEVAYSRVVELDEHVRISTTLQAAMLRPVSDLPTVAARYLPAVGGLAVGGDWYDVVSLDDRRRAVVVGDCVGHGLEAATVMAQLRTAARTMVIEGHDPAAAVHGLDLFAAHIDGALCTTVLCAIFDRDAGNVTYCRAGHPPGLVVGADGPTWLDGAGGPPLGIELGPRRNHTAQLSHGDLVVLFSDGLVERRGEALDAGLARLAAAAAALRSASVHDAADGLLGELLPDGGTDDVVLVVKRIG